MAHAKDHKEAAPAAAGHGHDAGHAGEHDHSHADGHGHGDGHGPHAVAPWILLATFGALIVLTVVTVKATDFDFGRLNIGIALGIATVKAALVTMFFMHLYWDRPVNIVAFLSSLLFLGIFLWFTLLDVGDYQSEIHKKIEADKQAEYEQRLMKQDAATKKAP